MDDQTIDVPLTVGSRVSVLTDISMDPGGFTASTVFEGVVEQYVPETNKLAFEESEIGYTEFMELLNEHGSVQVISE